MAPKKGTARVVKPRDKPRKPVKTSTDAVSARGAAKADNDLHLMWLCLKNNGGGQVDYQAVANALGITKSAAKQRYYKIKNHYENLPMAAQTTQGEDPKSEDLPEDEEDELPDYKSEDEDDQEMKQEQPESDSQEA